MDYKNDNRTPRDRITGEFLSELLFTDIGGDSCCEMNSGTERNCACGRQSVGASTVPKTNCRARSDSRSRSESNSYPRACSRRSCENSVEITGNYSLAMAYVQMEKFDNLFDIDTGFCEGTIFKGLCFPFYPTPCRKESF